MPNAKDLRATQFFSKAERKCRSGMGGNNPTVTIMLGTDENHEVEEVVRAFGSPQQVGVK